MRRKVMNNVAKGVSKTYTRTEGGIVSAPSFMFWMVSGRFRTIERVSIAFHSSHFISSYILCILSSRNIFLRLPSHN